MKYIKFMPYNSVLNASRNRRELAVAKEYGFEVFCYSSDKQGSLNEQEYPFRMIYDDISKSVYRSGVPHLVKSFQYYAGMFKHAKKLRNLHMDVISCHNIEALTVAWIAFGGLSKKKRPKRVSFFRIL